jgi:hypothetical protein
MIFSWMFLNWHPMQSFIRDTYLHILYNTEFDEFKTANRCNSCKTKNDVRRIAFSVQFKIPNTSWYDRCRNCYHAQRTKGIRNVIIVNNTSCFLNCWYKYRTPPYPICEICKTAITGDECSIWDNDMNCRHVCEACINSLPKQDITSWRR